MRRPNKPFPPHRLLPSALRNGPRKAKRKWEQMPPRLQAALPVEKALERHLQGSPTLDVLDTGPDGQLDRRCPPHPAPSEAFEGLSAREGEGVAKRWSSS